VIRDNNNHTLQQLQQFRTHRHSTSQTQILHVQTSNLIGIDIANTVE